VETDGGLMSDISAIMMTFNCSSQNPGLEVFNRSLDSLTNFPEKLAIDGGSTDDTVYVLKQHGFKVIQRKNIGPDNPIPRQSNFALRNIENEFGFFLDSDETINPDIYSILKNNHEDAWMVWMPRITMKNDTYYYKPFVPDPQSRFMKVGYAFWNDIPEEQLHHTPYVINGVDNNENVHTENEYTIKHWGYILTDENIIRIKRKYEWHNKLTSKAERNIFKNAELEKLDPVDYLRSIDVEKDNFK